MVDNRFQIRQFLEKHLTIESANNEFYKFDAMVRKKDNPDNVYMKHHNGSFLVHSWLISSIESYDKHIDEMVALCEATGARLYMTLDKKSTKSMATSLFDYANNLMLHIVNKNQISMKNIFNVMNSLTSKSSLNMHSDKRILFDIDTKSMEVLSVFVKSLNDEGVKDIIVLETLNGWHVNTENFDIRLIYHTLDKYTDLIDVKENALTLVYFDNKIGGENENI